jgi:hypothetical protein
MGPYHVPQIVAARDSFERIKLARIIFVIILSKRNLAAFHFGHLLVKSSDYVTLLGLCHRDVKDVHVIHVVYPVRVFEGKTEIGICSLFQIYDPTSLFFQLTNCTSERIEDFTTAAPASYKCPFFVSSIVDQ